jgi:hypothetical protein
MEIAQADSPSAGAPISRPLDRPTDRGPQAQVQAHVSPGHTSAAQGTAAQRRHGTAGHRSPPQGRAMHRRKGGRGAKRTSSRSGGEWKWTWRSVLQARWNSHAIQWLSRRVCGRGWGGSALLLNSLRQQALGDGSMALYGPLVGQGPVMLLSASAGKRRTASRLGRGKAPLAPLCPRAAGNICRAIPGRFCVLYPIHAAACCELPVFPQAHPQALRNHGPEGSPSAFDQRNSPIHRDFAQRQPSFVGTPHNSGSRASLPHSASGSSLALGCPCCPALPRLTRRARLISRDASTGC